MIVSLAAAAPALGDTTLAGRLQAGDREAALRMIREGADVNQTQGDGATPLHWAVYWMDSELVDALLARGADPSAMSAYGSSPLSEAVKTANTGLTAKLLEAGADVKAANQDGQTSLMIAARAGAFDAARLLVQHGADVNTKEAWRGQTALMWAADEHQPELVRFLIKQGADVHVRADRNDWPSQFGSEPRVHYRPSGGLTALLYAARAGCTDCVAAILDAGAEVDRPNPDGVTPLMMALDNGRFDTAKLLLERGASPHIVDWWGRTALYIAVEANSHVGPRPKGPGPAGNQATAYELIVTMLEAGADPNTQLNMFRPVFGANKGRFTDNLLNTDATPLIRAAIGHDVEAVRLLLAHGALVDLPNVMGVTPLMGASGMGISTRDYNLNFKGDVEGRAIATLELLLAAGADVHARVTDIKSKTAQIARDNTLSQREGQTALFGAVRMGWARVVTYLIEHGAKADAVDALGMQPVDLAEGRAGGRDNTVSAEMAELLRRAGGGASGA